MATLQNLRKAPVTGPTVSTGGGGYQKPVGGIPVTDLDTTTQTKINTATTLTKNATTGFFEAVVGTETALALPADENGNAKANFGLRRDTLASLLSLAGLPGEISRPTDYQGIVCHTGQVGGAYYIGNDVYKINITNDPDLIATQSVTIPRGFRTIVVGGKNEVPHANVATAGGFAISLPGQSGGTRPDAVDTQVLTLILLYNSSSAPAIQFGNVILDLSSGNNYFEVTADYDFSLNSAFSTVITSKTVTYA